MNFFTEHKMALLSYFMFLNVSRYFGAEGGYHNWVMEERAMRYLEDLRLASFIK